MRPSKYGAFGDDINGRAVIECKKAEMNIYFKSIRMTIVVSTHIFSKHKNLHVRGAHRNALLKLDVQIIT